VNIRLYDANLQIIRREIESASNPARALRHAYADLVSTFEIFCRKEATRLLIDKGRFQNIDEARRQFEASIAVDILEGLDPSQESVLRKVFEKRHLYEHNDGIVDQRYIEKIPDDARLIGQRAPLTIEELEQAADVLRIVLAKLVQARRGYGA
jgi:hypothetical protein